MKKYAILLMASTWMTIGINGADNSYNGGDEPYNPGQCPHSANLPIHAETQNVKPDYAETQNVKPAVSKELIDELAAMKKTSVKLEEILKSARGDIDGGGVPPTKYGFNVGVPMGEIVDEIVLLNTILSKLQRSIIEHSLKK